MDCALIEHGARAAGWVVRCAVDPDPWWKIALSIVTPVLVFASAIIAWRSLRNTRAVAKQRATLDLIEKAESTDHYRRLSTAFARARRENKFAILNDPPTPDDRELRQAVLDYFNHYELVAIGIDHDILDETIYRAWMQSHVVMEWNAAAVFIQNERWRLNADKSDFEYRGELFGNLQRAVCRWSGDAVRLTAQTGAKPVVTPDTNVDAPGDIPLPATNQVEKQDQS